MSMRVLIAGCGDLGCAVAQRLLDAGNTAFGLRRSDTPLPEGIQPIRADLTHAETLGGLPGDLDAVVYCPTPAERTEAAYREIFVTGQRNLLAALDAGFRMVFVSSTAVYGQDAGQWVDETAETTPQGFNGQVLLEGEQVAADHGAIVLRLGGLYGPGRERLIRLAESGAEVQADPPRWTNRIHLADAAAAVVHLLGLDSPEPVYNGVDPNPAPLWDVMNWLAGRLSAAAPPRGQGGGGAKRVSSQRLQDSGFRFEFEDYRAGYEAIIRSRRDSA